MKPEAGCYCCGINSQPGFVRLCRVKTVSGEPTLSMITRVPAGVSAIAKITALLCIAVLQDTQVGGHHVPKGMTVAANVYSLHRYGPRSVLRHIEGSATPTRSFRLSLEGSSCS